MIDRIQTWYDRSTSYDRDEGAQAYDRYHVVLQSFADFWGVGLVPTVEAFAALSPNNDYFGNLRSLASVLEHCTTGREYTVSTYNACAVRAIGYVKGEVSFLDTVKGKKITAFRHNLLYPTTSKRVTVDGHMVAIMAGKDTDTMKDAVKYFRSYNYDEFEAPCIQFARRLKIRPHELQATLWLCRKRVLAIKSSSQIDAFYGADDINKIMVDPRDCPPYKVEPKEQAHV